MRDKVCRLFGTVDIKVRMQEQANRSEQERKPDPARKLARRCRLAGRLLPQERTLDYRLIRIDNNNRMWIRIQ